VGHIGCFHSLVIANSAAINIFVQVLLLFVFQRTYVEALNLIVMSRAKGIL
jgi:hypothetical protein